MYIFITYLVLTMYRVWGRGEELQGFWRGNLRERDHWGDLGVDGRIILRWVFRKWDVRYGLDRTSSG